MASNNYQGLINTLRGLLQQKSRNSQNISRETTEIENALAHCNTFGESQTRKIAEEMNAMSAASNEYAQLEFDSKEIKAALSEKMELKANEDLVRQSIENVDNAVLDHFKACEAKENDKMQASAVKITKLNNQLQAQETENIQLKEKSENRKEEIDAKKAEYSKKMVTLKENEMQIKNEIKVHEESISKMSDELKKFNVELDQKQKCKANITKENQEWGDKFQRATMEIEERNAAFERLKLQLSGKIKAARNSLDKNSDLQISLKSQQVTMVETKDKIVKCIELKANAPKPLINKSESDRLKAKIAEDESNVLKNQDMLQLRRENLRLEQQNIFNLQQQANSTLTVLDNEKEKSNLSHIQEKVNAQRLELQEAKFAQNKEEAALKSELQNLTSDITNLIKKKDEAADLHSKELNTLREKGTAVKAEYGANKVVLKTWHSEMIIYKKGIKECKAKQETKKEKPRNKEEQAPKAATSTSKDHVDLSQSSQSSMASYNGMKVPKFNPAVFKFPPKNK